MKKPTLFKYLYHTFILLVDLTFVAICFLLAVLTDKNIGLSIITDKTILQNLYFLIMLRLVFFCVFVTYSGIISDSIFQNIKRVCIAVLGSSLTIWIIQYNTSIFDLPFSNSITNFVLVTDFIFILLVLISYRFIFNYLLRTYNLIQFQNFVAKPAHIPTLIYGIGQTGQSIKKAICQENFGMQLVGFLDDDNSVCGKIIDGIKVYNTKKDFDKLIKTFKIKNVIIDLENIEYNCKQEFIDICLKSNLNIMRIPAAKDWAGDELNANEICRLEIEDLLEQMPIIPDNNCIKNQICGKTIMISGAAGSIGSEITRQLLCFEPYALVLIDQAETALVELCLEIQEQHNFKNVIGLIADVSLGVRMNWIFIHHKPDIIFHAAAYKHVPIMEENPYEAIKTNILGTKNLADMAIKYGVEKFVMISTDKAVNPTNVMGASKRIAEIYIQSLNDTIMDNKTRFVTTRFGNVIGSNGSVIPRFKKQIEAGGPVRVTDAHISRYFMTIGQACQLVLEAAAMGQGGEIFVFEMGKPVKILDLAIKMIQLAGLIPNKDIQIVFTGLRQGEKIEEELLSENEQILPTHNQKIMIGKVQGHSFEQVNRQITDLTNLLSLSDFDNKTAVTQMKAILPEFLSHNSVYTELDFDTLNLSANEGKQKLKN